MIPQRCRTRTTRIAISARSNLPNAPITTVKDEPASPNPIRTPAERYISPGVVAKVIQAKPMA